MPEPEKRQLVWVRGTVDGGQAPEQAFPPFNVPPPYHTRRQDIPAATELGNQRHHGGRGNTEVRREEPRAGQRDDRGDKDGRRNDNRDGRRGRPPTTTITRVLGGTGGTTTTTAMTAGTNAMGALTNVRLGPRPWLTSKSTGSGIVPHACRRGWGADRSGGRRHGREDDAAPSPHELKQRREQDLKLLFSLQAPSFQEVIHNLQKPTKTPPQEELSRGTYVNKVSSLADKLSLACAGPEGDEASSVAGKNCRTPRRPTSTDIPVSLIFHRLKFDLQVPQFTETPALTVEEVEAALDRMVVQPEAPVTAQADPQELAPDLVEITPPSSPSHSPAMALDIFFATPPRPALHHAPPPAAVTRRRRTYDMSNVRRSARLAKKPALPAVQRAQANLCRKLGLTFEDRAPIIKILEEYVAMYNGPLPSQVVAALSTLFGIDDDMVAQLDTALMELVGDGVDELQHGEELAER